MELVLGKTYYAMKTRDIYKMMKVEEARASSDSKLYANETLFLHGKEIPVINLRQLFDLPKADYTKAARIIVIRDNSGYAGFIVDQVNKVSTLSNIQSDPGSPHLGGGSYVWGTGQSNDKQVNIIDTDRLLQRVLPGTAAQRRISF